MTDIVERLRRKVQMYMLSNDTCDGKLATTAAGFELANPDGPPAASLIEQLRSERDRLREALEPFAKAADMADERMIAHARTDLPDDTTVLGALNLTLGHIRRARTALSPAEIGS